MNKTHSNEILAFKNLIDNGLDVIIRVKDMEFRLTCYNKKYLILIKECRETLWDKIGEETDYKEAELCFITEVNRYKDLSYEEVE